MLLLVAAAIGILGGLWHGGALVHFARLPFRWPLLFLIGLILRTIAFSRFVPPGAATIVLYSLAIGFLCAGMLANRRIVGIELVLLGLVLNAAVILANGGAMPITAAALRSVGGFEFARQLRETGPIGHVELAGPGTLLLPLGDIIPLSPTPGVGIVASVGDFAIAAGTMVIFYFGTLRPPRGDEPQAVPASGDTFTGTIEQRAIGGAPDGDDPSGRGARPVEGLERPAAMLERVRGRR